MKKFILKTDPTATAATTLTLPWKQRIKSRFKVVLDSGEDADVFLGRGEILRNRDILATSDGYTAQVVAAKEEVTTAYAESSRSLLLACYHLGNRNVEVEIGKNWVRYRQDHVLDEMVKGLGLTPETGLFPFEPEKGEYGTH